MAAIDLIITARLTDPPIGRFSRSIGWFALTSDPDVFMDPSGGGVLVIHLRSESQNIYLSAV